MPSGEPKSGSVTKALGQRLPDLAVARIASSRGPVLAPELKAIIALATEVAWYRMQLDELIHHVHQTLKVTPQSESLKLLYEELVQIRDGEMR